MSATLGRGRDTRRVETARRGEGRRNRAGTAQDLLLGDPGADTLCEVVRAWVAHNRHGSVSRSGFTGLVREVGGSACEGLLDAWLDDLTLPETPGG